MSQSMDEEQRLKTLRDLRVVDSGCCPEIDRITMLASGVFGTPISLVSIIDRDRQWSKSAHGIPAGEMPREMAFCHQAIQRPDIYEVTDPENDPLFRDNPLVTADPCIRYYCGAPLIAKNGDRLGTLCVVDTKAHAPLSMGKRLLLEELARQAMSEIELQARITIRAESKKDCSKIPGEELRQEVCQSPDPANAEATAG